MYRILHIFFFFFLTACQHEIVLEGFDKKSWQNDPLGCKNVRKSLLKNFDQHKKEIILLSSKEVISLLGKPDEKMLYERGQKFYIYYIEAGSQCKQNNLPQGKKILIRFDALDKVSEISQNKY